MRRVHRPVAHVVHCEFVARSKVVDDPIDGEIQPALPDREVFGPRVAVSHDTRSAGRQS
jgi:hypothetical protein